MSGTVFITGGSGLLALNWAASLRRRQSVTLALHNRNVVLSGVQTQRCVLDRVDEIVRTFDAHPPALVVHTAGLTSVELCEADPGLAQHVNVVVAVNVATACASRGVPLVHISTDHVFHGDAALVGEDQPVAPRNTYGRTKAEAEKRVLDAHPDALVVRTNFYGWGPSYRRSFSDRVIDALRRKESITLFRDVFYTPILADTLCRAVHGLAELHTRGIIHVVGDERASKFDVGLKIAQRFDLDSSLIRPGSLDDETSLVPRPRDMSLANDRASGLLGWPLGGIDVQLTTLREQEQLGLARELQNL